jgi:hypothetical protein
MLKPNASAYLPTLFIASGLALAGCAVGGGVALGPTGTSDRPVSMMTQGQPRTSGFKGAKANTGYAMFTRENGKAMLVVSDDFAVPDTPDPHWQVVDSRGRTYLLQRFDIKENKVNRRIELPSYVPDVAKVQVWCAWAEALLGEAEFDSPVR